MLCQFCKTNVEESQAQLKGLVHMDYECSCRKLLQWHSEGLERTRQGTLRSGGAKPCSGPDACEWYIAGAGFPIR